MELEKKAKQAQAKRQDGRIRIVEYRHKTRISLVRILLFLTVSCLLRAQTASDFDKAMLGRWVGTLEYRDYSEPAGSTKRVKLPTWLTVERQPAGLQLQYVYDDGPSKTVTETSLLQVDPQKTTWGKENFSTEGFEALKEGRGTLMFRGSGTENGKPAEVKTTLRIGRNILEITRETGIPGEPLAFRHTYTFIRATAPVPR